LWAGCRGCARGGAKLLISVAEPLVKAADVYAVPWQAESLWNRRVEGVQ
jgi:hypothetical protein